MAGSVAIVIEKVIRAMQRFAGVMIVCSIVICLFSSLVSCLKFGLVEFLLVPVRFKPFQKRELASL